MPKSALITGGAGFVGQHMMDALIKRGYEVLTVDTQFMDIKLDFLKPHLHLVQDARDFFRKTDQRFDLVVHLAAVVGGRKQIEGDPLSLAVDLSIDADFFQWVVKTHQPRVVYYSSSAAYPVRLQSREIYDNVNVNIRHLMWLSEQDIDLEDVESPDLTYGWAKLTGEMLAQYAEKQGTRVHVFRPFSGYGEDQALDYPFPSFIDRSFHGVWPFEVWGDGTQVRDFIHIDDVIEGTLQAVEQDVEGPSNLCTGRPTSFNELAVMCMNANPDQYGDPIADNEWDRAIKHLKTEPTGVHYRVGNPTRMYNFYTPQVTLEQGVERALAWRKSHGSS